MGTYDDFIAAWRGGEEEFEVRTSGSTGAPKLIRLKRSEMERSALRSISALCLKGGDFLYSCISPDTIGGKMMCVRAQLCGAEFGWETPSNVPSIRRVTAGGRVRPVSLVSVVPSQMDYVTRHPGDFRHVAVFLIGGQAVPADLAGRIESLGFNAWESYGMTETASHIALRRVSAVAKPFRPLGGISISRDERGCLVIEGARDESVVTNDLAVINPDGSFYVTGRADEVIVSGGKKVHPAALEREIGEILSLRCRYMVVGLPDEKWGERVALVLEGVHMDAASLRKMLERLRGSLEGWRCPKEITVLEDFATAPGSKLKRSVLRERILREIPENSL